MTTQTDPNQLTPAISRLLDALRKRIRRYVATQGIALSVITLGLLFWVSLALDWLFEPPVSLRVALLVAYGCGALYVIYRTVLTRLLVPLKDRSMAVLLERQFSDFGDGLLTTVEMTDHPDHATEFSPEMLGHARDEAISRVEAIDLEKVFDFGPLAYSVALAVLVLISVLAFGFSAHQSMGVWARRSLMFSDELWPRSTRLVLEGFESQFGVVVNPDNTSEVHVFAGEVRLDPHGRRFSSSELSETQALRLGQDLDGGQMEVPLNPRAFAQHIAASIIPAISASDASPPDAESTDDGSDGTQPDSANPADTESDTGHLDRDSSTMATTPVSARLAAVDGDASGEADSDEAKSDESPSDVNQSTDAASGDTASKDAASKQDVSQTPSDPDAQHKTVATVSLARDCQWAEGQTPLTLGSRIDTGRHQLESGLLELTFDTGTRVMLNGPCDFEPVDANSLLLHTGRAMARVPRHGQGFVIDTPATRVTDLGNDVAKIARGGDLDLLVKADAAKHVPRVVEVRYRTEDGRRERRNMTREGNAQEGRDAYQDYKHTFRRVTSPVDLDVYGGDTSLSDLHIEVVDSPTLVEPMVSCVYPNYMNRSPEDRPVTGVMQLPYGTKVTYRAQSTKDLLHVRIDERRGTGERFVHEAAMSEDLSNTRQVEFDLGELREERTLLFQVADTDGILNRDLIRLSITPAPDAAPKLTIQTPGIGTAVTNHVRIPFEGEINDDYGLVKTEFEYQVDDTDAKRARLPSQPAGHVAQDVDASFDVRELDLQPGKKLSLAIVATDNYDLSEAPNEGSTERLLLEVVTDDELRARLEARELNLRRRFESIIEEVIETRDILVRVTRDPRPSEKPVAGDAGDESTEDSAPMDPAASDNESEASQPDAADKPDTNSADTYNAGDNGETPTEGDSTTPADEENAAVADNTTDEGSADSSNSDEEQPAETPLEDWQRAQSLNQLRTERALQNTQKNAEETTSVRISFQDILVELTNNGIDSEELQERLADGIAKPLEERVEVAFGKLVDELNQLQRRSAAAANLEAQLAEGKIQPEEIEAQLQQVWDSLDAAQAESDRLLVEMQSVLEKMLELETFNEVVDLLRSIIESQDKIQEETEKRRKEQLRDLLD